MDVSKNYSSYVQLFSLDYIPFRYEILESFTYTQSLIYPINPPTPLQNCLILSQTVAFCQILSGPP